MAAVATLATAAGCGSGGSGLRVVASTNVYGDIAGQIAGRDATVTSLLTSPDADPHLFEPGTEAGLQVARARVLVENGLGYDTFVERLADASPSSSRVTVNVADVLGVSGDGANPHLWYDLPRIPRVARAIAAALVRVDPKHARGYRSRLSTFVADTRRLSAIRLPRGRSVAATEPVADRLLAAYGIRDRTPEEFARAIENGTEPSPAAVSALQNLLRTHAVDALVYNEQAVSPITKRMSALAKDSNVPVVGVTETLPPHLDFQQWQRRQLLALRRALTP